MSAVAIIAARGGSVRVPEKNFKSFYRGQSLLQIKIEQLKKVPGLDAIIVSSEHPKILDQAMSAGVVPQHRPEEFATSEIPAWKMYEYIASMNQQHEFIFWVTCTSPLLREDKLSDIFAARPLLMGKGAAADSINTVTPVKGLLWAHGRVPVNYDPTKQVSAAHHNVRLDEINFAANVIRPKTFLKRRNPVGENPFFTPLDEIQSIDIDTPFDWEVAQHFYSLCDGR